MDNAKLKEMHQKLQDMIGATEQLPIEVTEAISNLIPPASDGEDVYIYTNLIESSQEMESNLILYDKEYSSRLHSYGNKDELLYAWKSVKTGKNFNHRVSNNKTGVFHTEKYIMEAEKIDPTQPNVFLFKTTEWDSVLYDNKKISYTIMVYRFNKQLEDERRKNIEDVIAKVQAEYKKSSAGGLN